MFQNSAFHGLGAQTRRIDAPAIVADFNNDLGALMKSVEIDSASRRLAGCQTLIRLLDTMINRVADEMHERFGKRVQNALVEVGVLARELQGHILATLLGNVANDARETPEKLLDGDHTDFQNAFVELLENTRLKCHGVRKFGAQGITRVLLVELG